MKKEEQTTYLAGGEIVEKTHPRIELRGRIDGLSAAIIALQAQCAQHGEVQLIAELEAVKQELADLLACEYTGAPCRELNLWGLTADEIHERSHRPADFYGLGHIRLDYTMGWAAAGINVLRTMARETELCACRAFGNGRLDIITKLNRLSSAFYILIYMHLPQGYDKVIQMGK